MKHMLRMYEAWHLPHEAQGVALHEGVKKSIKKPLHGEVQRLEA
jgi:hypothetical protein